MPDRTVEQLDVLLVEDDEEDFLLTKDMLSRLEGTKPRIHWANDYDSGLEAARAAEYDVCLVDYQLGAEDGIALVRELIARGHDMPVIVLTGHSDHDVDVEATRAGAADYLVKGEVSPALLERTIRYALRRHADLQALRDKEERLQRLNDELEQRVSTRTVELFEEKQRTESFYSFCRRLASGTDAGELARTILNELSAFAGAELGALYTVDPIEPDGLQLLAACGLEIRWLPRTLPDAFEEGVLRRSLDNRRAPESLSHEITVPLVQGDREVGVLLLAREQGGFSRPALRAIGHLADQAAVAIADALSVRRINWLANVNRAVLDATTDGIRLVDQEGRTLVANTAIERLTTEVFGLPADSTLHERMAIVDRLTDPAGYRATMARIAADPEAVTLDEFELTDSRRSFQRYTAPVRDASGSMLGRIIVVREVTAEHEAERFKADLLATVSHEVRTPLASILGFADLLVNRKVEPSTSSRYVEIIYKAAKRLTHLVNDFLDVQRIEEGRFALTREPFAVGELVREEVELYSGQSDAHTLELELPPTPLLVRGNRDRIGQVVGNLLSNAIKYSPDGGPVAVKAETTADVVRVSVRDSGLGIPAAQQRGIFTKFFRVDSSDRRRIGGTGLGLALCREIVDAHDGRIGFESAEGAGSTFWFELPALREAGALP